jgi:hypothetical protein
MRELIILMQNAIEQAVTYGREKINIQDVEAAVIDFAAFRRETAKKYLTELKWVADTKSISELPPDVQRELLGRRLVHEYYDREFWYDVGPMVVPILGRS